jgi:hypothetical protein
MIFIVIKIKLFSPLTSGKFTDLEAEQKDADSWRFQILFRRKGV